MTRNPIFCAIDTTEVARAKQLASSLAGLVGGIKLGLEFFVANGPEGVRAVVGRETPLFLDLKLHDIPNTVAGAVRAVASLAPAFLTLHCGGGAEMMRQAVREARASSPATKLLGVTVLTSLDAADLDAVGQQGPVAEQARRLALLARDCGLDGLVCSPHEVAALRAAVGSTMQLVVPGIRPAGAGSGDQKRVMGPAEALAAGADWLVIGRPITAASDPAAAARAIRDEIAAGAGPR
jgi:orotidine-5'-phosphate decarboxylase